MKKSSKRRPHARGAVNSSAQIQVRCTPAEKNRFAKSAAKLNVNLSSYTRWALYWVEAQNSKSFATMVQLGGRDFAG
jgi:hypothetical protein